MNWLRLYHGTPEDPKFAMIARRVKVPPAEVLALWVYCLDFASRAEDRGAVEGLDTEEASFVLGVKQERIDEILQMFRDRGMIDAENRLTAWDRRQPKRERDDDSADRVRRFRDKKRTVTPCNAIEAPGNANVTHETPRTEQNRTDKSREEQNREETASVTFQPEWKKDASFHPFVEAWTKTGAAVTDDDFLQAHSWAWKKLDFEQKAAAVRGTEGRWADPAYIPRPRKYLESHEWNRPIVRHQNGSGQSQHSRRQEAIKQALEQVRREAEAQ